VVALPPLTLRIVTYNVHRCIGRDGVLSAQRIARVIGRHQPDLVALQELEVDSRRFGDQPRLLAKHLEMEYFFFPAVQGVADQYGDAILSRLPMRLVRAASLPAPTHRPGQERRGALWVEATFQGRTLQLVNTHLGLDARERITQIETLLGPDWLAHAQCTRPYFLCGDFNAWPGTRAYQLLRRSLRDAQEQPRSGRARSTFPAFFPFLRIDHVFHSPGIEVRATRVPCDREARRASDHLPLIVEFALP
jgi:endonuclease/exonuclease/phosphatase family metal-dependent hydrolase